MERISRAFVLTVFLVAGCEGRALSPQEKTGPPQIQKVIIEKERVEREEPPSPDVKIKLRRDGKDNYSWEISGSDVNQILKVNEKLRKQLTGEQSR